MKNCAVGVMWFVLTAVISITANAQQDNPPHNSRAEGQDYKMAVGIRLGSGLTVKDFIDHATAFEGMMTFGYNALLITGLLEKHIDITSAPGFKWLFGMGGHVGFFRYLGYYYWTYDYGNRTFYVNSPDSDATVAVGGVDFIMGLDYKFRNAPFNVGFDVKPFIDFYRGEYGFFDGAFSARLAF